MRVSCGEASMTGTPGGYSPPPPPSTEFGLGVELVAGRWASTTLCSVESGRGALGEGKGSLRTEPQILSNWGSSILSVSYPMMHPLEDWAETKVLLLKRKKRSSKSQI